MILFIFFLVSATIMVALGVKHNEPIMVVMGSLTAVYTAYSYGRFVETARAMSYMKKYMDKQEVRKDD